MKKILLIVLFISFGKVYSQNIISESLAAKLFGPKFISAKMAGLPKMDINFPQEQLELEAQFGCWLIATSKGYLLVQRDYLSLFNDTLDLATLKEILTLNTNFKKEAVLYRSKDAIRQNDSGTNYKKTIAYLDGNLIVFSLPSNAIPTKLTPEGISYAAKDSNDTWFFNRVTLKSNTPLSKDPPILTPTYIAAYKQSQ